MLSRLEEHLGVQLFERVRGGARLTESGSILYRRVQEGFSTIESAISEIEARATGIETVTLSVSTAFTTHWLMPRMRRTTPAVDDKTLSTHLARVNKEHRAILSAIEERDADASRAAMRPHRIASKDRTLAKIRQDG